MVLWAVTQPGAFRGVFGALKASKKKLEVMAEFVLRSGGTHEARVNSNPKWTHHQFEYPPLFLVWRGSSGIHHRCRADTLYTGSLGGDLLCFVFVFWYSRRFTLHASGSNLGLGLGLGRLATDNKGATVLHGRVVGLSCSVLPEPLI